MTLKIAFAGAQHTGKTTLARALAASFSADEYLTEYVSEYARQHTLRFGAITLDEQLLVTLKQLESERVSSKCQLLFTDSPIFLSVAYLMMGLDFINSRDTLRLTSLLERIVSNHYDVVFYLPIFRAVQDDGVRPAKLRSQNVVVDKRVRGYLDLFNIDYVTLDGHSVAQRELDARRILRDYLKKKHIKQQST